MFHACFFFFLNSQKPHFPKFCNGQNMWTTPPLSWYFQSSLLPMFLKTSLHAYQSPFFSTSLFFNHHFHNWLIGKTWYHHKSCADLWWFLMVFHVCYPLVNVYITMENHHFLWENSLFLWSFSIAMLVITRGYWSVMEVSEVMGVPLGYP